MKPLFNPIYLLLCVIVFSTGAQKADNELIRVLSTGSLLKGAKITMSDNSTVHLYLGIPYAEPPVEENRYKAPITRKKWNGILDATYYKVSCLYDSPNFNDTLTARYMSEDCLHLSVITSELCVRSGGCPVAVYLHGSNFNYASSLLIPVEDIARNWATKNITVVTINFRLGSFGFLNLGAKTTAAKNAGLLDQLEALRWIQREIGHFGGDAGRVTLLGWGTGAINVDLLAISPATGGLFHQIAMIGGAAGTMSNINKDSNVAATRKLAIEAKCATTVTWDMANKEDIVGCLRAKDASELLAVQRFIEDKSKFYAFDAPVRDVGFTVASSHVHYTPHVHFCCYHELTESKFWVVALNKRRRAYSMMIGSVSNSVSWLKDALKPNLLIPNKKILKVICQFAVIQRHFNLTGKLVKACQKEYSTVMLGSNLIEDVAIVLPIYDSASANTANGGTTFLFEYFSDNEKQPLFSFASTNVEGAKPDYPTAAISQFVKTGDPSTDEAQWQPFTTERDNFVALTNASLPMNVDSYHFEAVNFWTKTAPKIVEQVEWLKENGTSLLKDVLEARLEAIFSLKAIKAMKVIEKVKEKWNNIIKDAIVRITSLLEDLKEKIEKQEKAAVIDGNKWMQESTCGADIVIEMNKLIDQILSDIHQLFVSDSFTVIKSDEEQMNSLNPAVRVSIVRSISPTTISEGIPEQTEPMFAQSVDEFMWSSVSSTWFWIIHGVGVVIIIALIIIVCIMYCRRNKKRAYESLS
ncbi:Cocaine esterase [Toxocara canis]|uniref:Cocaine esterase n=1 Tax=Toxocara canis TaxID=6265 RepID=A0A0B2VLR5_TOXCA|nr:Cocaine esterase [Toxocara canis]